ncbi:MAG TPA: 50S ribosomal protein L23 [Fimbriimonadaceae bacterium]|nr:50S ribosomal protein L23 [Fimbriimonadaceae bacterium]
MGQVRDPHEIIVRPRITERSMHMSYGDQRILDESKIVRKYTFEVATHANKLEIKAAVEAIYNAGKKVEDAISVTNVRTIRILGKKRRRTQRTSGYTPDRKKAIVTLAAGQILEDYGV